MLWVTGSLVIGAGGFFLLVTSLALREVILQ